VTEQPRSGARRWRRWPLVLVLVLVATAIGATASYTSYEAERDDAVDDHRDAADQAQQVIGQFVANRIQLLRTVSVAPSVQGQDVALERAFTAAAFEERGGGLRELGVIDADGNLVALGQAVFDPIYLRFRDYVDVPLRTGEPYVGTAVLALAQPDPLFVIAVPIVDDEGAVRGLVSSGVQLAELNDATALLRPAVRRNVFVVDRAQQVLFAGGPVRDLQRATNLGLLERMRAAPALDETGVGLFGDEDHLVSARRVGAAEWLVVAETPTGTAFGGARDRLRVELALLAVLLVTGLGGAWLLRRRETEAEARWASAAADVAAERRRYAREVNDDVVQGFVAAEMALDLGETEHARAVVAQTSRAARQWVGELLAEEGGLKPGGARREAPAMHGAER